MEGELSDGGLGKDLKVELGVGMGAIQPLFIFKDCLKAVDVNACGSKALLEIFRFLKFNNCVRVRRYIQLSKFWSKCICILLLVNWCVLEQSIKTHFFVKTKLVTFSVRWLFVSYNVCNISFIIWNFHNSMMVLNTERFGIQDNGVR